MLLPSEERIITHWPKNSKHSQKNFLYKIRTQKEVKNKTYSLCYLFYRNIYFFTYGYTDERTAICERSNGGHSQISVQICERWIVSHSENPPQFGRLLFERIGNPRRQFLYSNNYAAAHEQVFVGICNLWAVSCMPGRSDGAPWLRSSRGQPEERSPASQKVVFASLFHVEIKILSILHYRKTLKS
jgi:hypothetical protein